ncbi:MULTISPECIES: hypothetical protein [Flavobacterium]|uniref:Uncharacterized protein n=1 Tax=Flavobacterium covae TaxID=2906076 RepID=A0ABW8PG98_9FLAO|nr:MULTISPECIES: hypothetical protein [Flavobacterium]AMA49008.1 hypothetical protein AWN65_05785 [Flavobacterium covae]MCJ1807332.1 hypothetical protein [Flavobacterium covae]MCJ1809929.1 hypothetical protein [Flavobacterium covae]OWP80054.1 hypothetical protein BWK63_13060 [Flavobacterium covae]POR19702.1 hypothetical protein BWK57_13470 [Flavobacterium columnare]
MFILFYLFIFQSYKDQKIISDLERKNLIVFNFTDNNSKLFLNNSIYSKDKLRINSSVWSDKNMGVGNFNREYYFLKDKDTMSIVCISCGKAENYYYFKNLEYGKGNYELKI